jgi:hypothetical protein
MDEIFRLATPAMTMCYDAANAPAGSQGLTRFIELELAKMTEPVVDDEVIRDSRKKCVFCANACTTWRRRRMRVARQQSSYTKSARGSRFPRHRLGCSPSPLWAELVVLRYRLVGTERFLRRDVQHSPEGGAWGDAVPARERVVRLFGAAQFSERDAARRTIPVLRKDGSRSPKGLKQKPPTSLVDAGPVRFVFIQVGEAIRPLAISVLFGF